MIVYHGAVETVQKPDVLHSYRNLDFGKGFYVTSVKEQAERWALRKADLIKGAKAIMNEYTLLEDWTGFVVKDFSEDMDEWIDFVFACRDGNSGYKKFDIIKGKVANDKVYRVVNFYKSGIWDKERAIHEMKAYKTYDQIAFISQKAIDVLLTYHKSYEVIK